MERVICGNDFVVQDGWGVGHSMSNEILTNYHNSYTSWANILLCTKVYQAILQNDKTREVTSSA